VYVFRVYRQEQHLHSYSDAEPVSLQRKKDKTAEILSKARRKEKFYDKSEGTVSKRRKGALERLRVIEAEQAEYAETERMIKEQMSLSSDSADRRGLQRKLKHCRENPNLLVNYNPKMAKVGASVTSRQRQCVILHSWLHQSPIHLIWYPVRALVLLCSPQSPDRLN
jgi:hypothetical protein